MQNELWRHNFVNTITEVYTRLPQNKVFQVEVDRVEFCSSHMQVTDTEVEMSDIDEAGAKEQYLNLFALVKAIKQLPSSYERETEYLIAHFQTQVCGNPESVRD